jgi:hypothetical protein
MGVIAASTIRSSALGLRDGGGDLLGLAFPEEGGGPRLADPEMKPPGDLDTDRLGKPSRFVEPRFDVARRRRSEVGKCDDGARAAGEIRLVAVEAGGQAPCSSSCASTKLIGLSGCTVEMACL